MKLVFSCFMIPVYIALGVAGLGCLLIFLDASGCRPVENTHSFFANMYFCLLHFSMAVSLVLTILTGLYCCVMTIAGFILKTWLGAGIAIAGVVVNFMMAQFLMNTVI